jgi:dihydroxyacetone kinase DhaKLM complex PTS-EIIA-like component DhaM
MVGIVVVSHSEQLAAGVVELARQMAGERLTLEAAGGIGELGVLGTDAERVREAIVRAMSKDGMAPGLVGEVKAALREVTLAAEDAVAARAVALELL